MEEDFYCNQVLNNRVEIEKVAETENVLAYYHTRPFYATHIVVIPKKHISSLLTLGAEDYPLLVEIIEVVKKVAAMVVEEKGACRVLTNLGAYQESKHLHWHVFSGNLSEK